MAKTKEVRQEVEHTLRKLREVHPLMTLNELDTLVADVITYRNRAIIYKDDVIKRITVKPNEAEHTLPDNADTRDDLHSSDDGDDF